MIPGLWVAVPQARPHISILRPRSMPIPMYLKYFGIRVTDIDRFVKFYTDLLGLKEVGRGDMSVYGGGRGTWVLLRDTRSGRRLELDWYPKGRSSTPRTCPGRGRTTSASWSGTCSKSTGNSWPMGSIPRPSRPRTSRGGRRTSRISMGTGSSWGATPS